MYLSTSCFASPLVLQPLPFTSSRSGVLKKDSASALSHGLPGRDMDWAVPWDSRQRWNAREACWEPWSSWKARLKSPGGLSPPTACPSASATGFSVMRPDIDQPTAFLWNASIAAARQGHPFARSDAGDPPLLRRPQGAERLQRPEDDASRDREGVEQGAQRRPEADRRDRQLQQARLVEVQGGPRVVRSHSEPGAQGQGGPGLPVLLGTQGARRLQRPGRHASRHGGHVAPAHEQALGARRRAGRKPQARMVARRVPTSTRWPSATGRGPGRATARTVREGGVPRGR